MARSALLVLARYPEPGRVKTRLAAGVGEQRAFEVYERLLRRTATAATAVVAADRSLTVTVHVTPAYRIDAMRTYLPDPRVGFCPQPDGDLGERLEAAFALAFAGGADRAVAIGTDCPDLDEHVLCEALHRLDGTDAVLGPSTDGGYYLVGLSRPRPELFRDVPWSTDAVLRVTLERLHAQGAHVALLPRLSDLDTADDLAALAPSRPWVLDDQLRPLSRRSGLPPLGEANRCERPAKPGARLVPSHSDTGALHQ